MKRFNVLLLIATFSMNASWAASNLEDSRDEELYKKARTHIGWGIYYSKKKDFTTAIAEYTKALEIQEFVGEKRALCLRNLANVYHNLGDIYAGGKKFTAAITQYTTALAIEEFVGKERALCHRNLANAYRIKKNFTSAITQYIAALEIQEFVGEKRALCHFILGDIYAGQKEFTNAITQYTAALEIQKFVGEKRELCLTSLNNANDRKNGSVLLGAKNFTPFDYIDEKNGRCMVRSCR